MNVNLGVGSLLVLFAIICFAIAFIAVVFEVDNAKLYPATIALGLATGFAGLKFP